MAAQSFLCGGYLYSRQPFMRPSSWSANGRGCCGKAGSVKLYKGVGESTYIVLPSSRNTTMLPWRLWGRDESPRARASSSTRLYVPTQKYSVCSGENSMQLGGRSSVSDWIDAKGSAMFVVYVSFGVRSFSCMVSCRSCLTTRPKR